LPLIHGRKPSACNFFYYWHSIGYDGQNGRCRFGRIAEYIQRPDCRILLGYAALRVILSLTAQLTTRRL
jgi:hypothetical protein